MSRAMARPKPVHLVLIARIIEPQERLNTSSRILSGIPEPSSSTVMVR